MKYFTENKNDLEGYKKNIKSLQKLLDHETFRFMINNSFHDSLINKLAIINNHSNNNKEPYDSEISPVSVCAQLTYWNDKKYELLWEDVSVYSVDFDVTRNQVVETGQILYKRGLDQWSHDELVLTKKGLWHHQIILYSQTKVTIKCKKFTIRSL